jgi:hypothetical protein
MFEHWEAAEATVVATRRLSNWSRQGVHGPACPYEYIVDVRPDGQPVFRATFHDALMHGSVNHPAESDVVNVLFDAKSQRVKLSDEYKLDQHQQDQDRADSFRAIADAPPDSPAPAAASQGSVRRISA